MKKLLSIVMAVALLAVSGTSSYATERDEVAEALREQVQNLQVSMTAHEQRQAELVWQGTPAEFQNSEAAEIRAQLNAIRTKLQAEQIQIQAQIKQTTVKEQDASQFTCSKCGEALRLDETKETGSVACQKYPLDMQIMDESKAYYYECDHCANEDIYFKAVCLH